MSFTVFTAFRIRDVPLFAVIATILFGLPAVSIIARLPEKRMMSDASVTVVQMTRNDLIGTPETNGDMPLSAEIGQTAPEFSLVDVAGQTLSLSGLSGRPVVLYFWATWCNHCDDGFNDLRTFREQYTAEQLNIIAINILESGERVQSYVNAADVRLPVLLDHNGSVSLQYNLKAVPTYVFIDGDGIITAIASGQLRPGTLEGQIAPIISGESG